MRIRLGRRPWTRDLRRLADGDVVSGNETGDVASDFMRDLLASIDTDLATFDDDATARESLLRMRRQFVAFGGRIGAGRPPTLGTDEAGSDDGPRPL